MLHGNIKLSNLGEHDKVFFELKQVCPVGIPFSFKPEMITSSFYVPLTTLSKESNFIYQPCGRAQILHKIPKLILKEISNLHVILGPSLCKKWELLS